MFAFCHVDVDLDITSIYNVLSVELYELSKWVMNTHVPLCMLMTRTTTTANYARGQPLDNVM